MTNTSTTSALTRPTVATRGWSVSPNLLLAAVILGAVGTVALWCKDTPSIYGFNEWITSTGRVLGLLAGYGVIVLLGLMARVPAVERGVGADRLARWHSMGGRYIVSLIVAHALFITWGYSLTDRRNVFGETYTLWTEYADVLMGTVAAGLFLLIGITSARAARRKMHYETWHLIHLYTYLAIALAFSHQFSTGEEFINDRVARAAWATLYIAMISLLVWFRFITPIRQFFRHNLRVERVIPEGPNVVSIWISGRHLDEMMVESGQFFRWRFLTKNLWWAANPYSLSAAPQTNRLRITVQNVGDHSLELAWLKAGTRVFAEGPYGAMTAARRTRPGVLLIAGGVGITPLRALFESLPGQTNAVSLIYRASEPQDILFRSELDQIAAARGVKVFYSIGKRGTRNDVVRPGVLQQVVPDVRERDVYLCGPAGLTQAAHLALRSARVPRRRIHTENFEF